MVHRGENSRPSFGRRAFSLLRVSPSLSRRKFSKLNSSPAAIVPGTLRWRRRNVAGWLRRNVVVSIVALQKPSLPNNKNDALVFVSSRYVVVLSFYAPRIFLYYTSGALRNNNIFPSTTVLIMIRRPFRPYSSWRNDQTALPPATDTIAFAYISIRILYADLSTSSVRAVDHRLYTHSYRVICDGRVTLTHRWSGTTPPPSPLGTEHARPRAERTWRVRKSTRRRSRRKTEN